MKRVCIESRLQNCRLKSLAGTGLIALLILAMALPAMAADVYKGHAKAKYVFYFIGDGLGMPQRTAAEMYLGKNLVMQEFPAQGITTTFAADRFITGSAAAATALGAGVKTNIGMIGMTPNQTPVKSLAHLAKEQGKKVGIISSVSIDHATPAAFYAHVPKRSMYHHIDHQMVASDFDFFAGGGLKDPVGKRLAKKGKKDQIIGDAFEAAKEGGYKVVTEREAILGLKPSDGKVIAINSWLQDSGAMPYDMDRRGSDVSLKEFTSKAIDMLDGKKGFFIMVEGGKIDWACHANDAKASIEDTAAFDEAIAEAVAFYKKHPKETLIVVTGDHETGGLTLGFAGTKYKSYFDVLGGQYVSFQRFDDEFFALYKQECSEAGTCSFDNFKPAISFYFGLEFEGDGPNVVKPYQEKMLSDAFLRSMAGEMVQSADAETNRIYGGYDPLTVTITHVLNNNAGLAWTSYKHTGVPVATSAMGVGAEVFNGYYDNTDLALKIMSVMGVSPHVYTADVMDNPAFAGR